jgi:hypothetical protein
MPQKPFLGIESWKMIYSGDEEILSVGEYEKLRLKETSLRLNKYIILNIIIKGMYVSERSKFILL